MRTFEPEDTTASRCLSLIARHAPRLMREGGGSIKAEVFKQPVIAVPEPPTEPKRATISEAEKALFVALFQQKKRPSQIARIAGRSCGSVARVLLKAGLMIRKPRKQAKAQIVQLLQTESNMAVIARQLGVTRAYVAAVAVQMREAA